MAEDNKSMFVLISIVAIVAVVGLVVLILGRGGAQYAPVASEVSVGEEANLAGEAYVGKLGCTDSDGGENIYKQGTVKGYYITQNKLATYIDTCRYGDGVNKKKIGVEEGHCGTVQKIKCNAKNEYCENKMCVECTNGYYYKITNFGSKTGTNIIPGPNWYECKYGCKNGACKKAPNSCTDSDWNVLQGGDTFLGNSIYTVGFTQSTESGVPTMANDYCTTNSPKINDPDDGEWKFIIEQICKNMGDGNIEAWTSNQKCPVGYVCPEGKSACVKE